MGRDPSPSVRWDWPPVPVRNEGIERLLCHRRQCHYRFRPAAERSQITTLRIVCRSRGRSDPVTPGWLLRTPPALLRTQPGSSAAGAFPVAAARDGSAITKHQRAADAAAHLAKHQRAADAAAHLEGQASSAAWVEAARMMEGASLAVAGCKACGALHP